MKILEFIRYYSLKELQTKYLQRHDMPLHQIWNWDFLEAEGVEMDEVPPMPTSGSRLLRQLFMDNIAQQRAVLDRETDIIYAPFMGDAYYIALKKCLHLCNTPLVAIAQDTWRLEQTSGWKNRMKYRFVRFLAKNGVDRLLFISEGVYAQCKDYFDDETKQFPLQHWGVDVEYYDQYMATQIEKPANDYLFVTGGANRDFTLMERVSAMTEAEIWIQTNRCPKEIRENEKLRIDRSPTTWNDLLGGYYGALAVGVPLEQELNYMSGITVVLEGMACSKPILSTETNHYPFDLEKEKAGILLPLGDATAWADAIKYLKENPGEAREMGERGRHIVDHRHNYRMFCEEMLRVFKSVR